jgi:hypothetical protein
MSNWAQILPQILGANSVAEWLAAALVFLLTFTVLPVMRSYIRSRRGHYANRDLPTPVALLAYLLERTSRIVQWIVALYVADRILTLPGRLDRALEIAIVVGCWLQVGMWAGAAARFGLQREQVRAGGDPALGVGGIAIALAVQTILGDLFASLSIASTSPLSWATRCASTPSRVWSSRSASRARGCAA